MTKLLATLVDDDGAAAVDSVSSHPWEGADLSPRKTSAPARTKAGVLSGIASIKRNAADAAIVDLST